MTARRQVERRPAGRADVAALPADWVRERGEPPRDIEQRRAWIAAAITGAPSPTVRRPSRPDMPPEATRGDRIEHRSLATVPAPTIRADGPHTAGHTIAGLLVPFKSRSTDLGGFVEEFHPGAFDRQRRSTRFADVTAHWNHQRHDLLGTVKGGTLAIDVRPEGVRYAVTPPATGLGPYVAELVQRRDAAGASLGFLMLRDEWYLDGKQPVRRVLDAELLEASIVFSPAYAAATAAVRHRALSGGLTELDRARLAMMRKQLETKRADLGGRVAALERGTGTAPRLTLTDARRRLGSHRVSVERDLRRYGILGRGGLGAR